MTFSLEGFTTFKRDGVELTSNFTATVNGDLKVGSLQETVTVSGQSPVVDVQNTATRKPDFARGARHGADQQDPRSLRRAHARA